LSIQEYEDKLNNFIKSFDDFLRSNSITKTDLKNYDHILNMTHEELSELSQEDCHNAAFCLASHSASISLHKSKLQAIINWCDASLNEIIAKEMIESGLDTMIAKYEIKFGIILNKNILAKNINIWKITAQSRYDVLLSLEIACKRLYDILIEKGRRRQQ